MAASEIVLRDYQDTIVTATRAALKAHRRVVVVLSTGGGKTIIFSYIARSTATRGKRVVIVAHRIEIVLQISKALAMLGVAHGLIVAGAPLSGEQVLVGMVQTLARRLDQVGEPDLLVIDEAHHAITGSYRAVMDRWVRARVLGVTATPERLDGRGLDDVFDDMVIGPSMGWLIAGGYLAGYDYFAPPAPVSLGGIHTRAGDFAVDELAAVMDKPSITGDAIDHYAEHLGGRPAVAFCVTVEHARHVAETFAAAGYRAAAVDGTMSPDERRDRIGGLADGRLQVLTSCELISEGVDVPVCAGAVLLRPTKSLALHLQQVGRVLRLKPDGSRAVVLDHVGNVHRHGLPDAGRDWSLTGRKRRGAAAGVRTCPACFQVFPRGGNVACSGGDTCPLSGAGEGGGGRARPREEAGKLERVADPMAWTMGIDIATAQGREWRRLLFLAASDEGRLRQISRARGFKRGWVQHRIREHLRLDEEAQGILTRGDDDALVNADDDVLWHLIRHVECIDAPLPECKALRNLARWTLASRRSRAA